MTGQWTPPDASDVPSFPDTSTGLPPPVGPPAGRQPEDWSYQPDRKWTTTKRAAAAVSVFVGLLILVAVATRGDDITVYEAAPATTVTGTTLEAVSEPSPATTEITAATSPVASSSSIAAWRITVDPSITDMRAALEDISFTVDTEAEDLAVACTDLDTATVEAGGYPEAPDSVLAGHWHNYIDNFKAAAEACLNYSLTGDLESLEATTAGITEGTEAIIAMTDRLAELDWE